jgi:hypothetical protein
MRRKKELNSCIEDLEARQRNLIWPDVLRGGRSVDEFLWKGAREAPLVQRIGAVVLALAYVMVGLAFVSMSLEQGKWFIGAFAAILFHRGWLVHPQRASEVRASAPLKPTEGLNGPPAEMPINVIAYLNGAGIPRCARNDNLLRERAAAQRAGTGISAPFWFCGSCSP